MRGEGRPATYPGRADRGDDDETSCANCKMPIEDEPVVSAGRTFCCDGCADGGPCLC